MTRLSSLEKKFELLTNTLNSLAICAAEGIPIIVEGRNDRQALDKLQINGPIMCIKSSREVLFDVLDRIRSKEVILFLDFDEGGRTLVKKIVVYLDKKGIKVNQIFWKRIGALLRRDVKDVEGLPSYLEKLKNQVEYHPSLEMH